MSSYQRPQATTRHGRARPGHPRRQAAVSQDEKPRILSLFLRSTVSFAAWMAGTSPAMTMVGVFGDWYEIAISGESHERI
jgi:hypothetical protein